MFASYIDSLTDTEWLGFVLEAAVAISLPSAVLIDWIVASIRDNHKRMRLAWRIAKHVMTTGSVKPRLVSSRPHQA